MLDQTLPILSDIATAVRSEQCVLFLGAGVHAPAPPDSSFKYDIPDRPLIGSELSLHLAKQSDFLQRRPEEDPKNLPRVSMDFELQKGRSLLINEVRSSVQTNKKPSPILQALARLPFRLVITTNYDTLFEDAASTITTAKKSPFVCCYRNNVTVKERTDEYPYRHDPSPQLPFLLKMHGDIVRNASSIVITDEDYIQFLLRMSDKDPYNPLTRTPLYFLSKWPTLFLGYSLRDYNLRLLFKSLRWQLDPGQSPEMYSVDHWPDPLLVEVLQDKRGEVRYVVEDVWHFVPELVKEVTGMEMTP